MSIFSNPNPQEVYVLTTEGLIPIVNSWVKNTDDLGQKYRFREFLKDDYTVGFLVGFVGHILDKHNITDNELVLCILASSIREAFSHVISPDDLYELLNDKLESYIKKLINNPNEDRPSSNGKLVADLYLRSVDNGKKYQPGSLSEFGGDLPNEYFENN